MSRARSKHTPIGASIGVTIRNPAMNRLRGSVICRQPPTWREPDCPPKINGARLCSLPPCGGGNKRLHGRWWKRESWRKLAGLDLCSHGHLVYMCRLCEREVGIGHEKTSAGRADSKGRAVAGGRGVVGDGGARSRPYGPHGPVLGRSVSGAVELLLRRSRAADSGRGVGRVDSRLTAAVAKPE